MKTRSWLLAAGLALAPLHPCAAQVRILSTPPQAIPDQAVEMLQAFRFQLLDYLELPRDVVAEGGRFQWLLDAGGLYELDLEAGAGDVAVLGVCDEDCSDLDVAVYSASDEILGKDDADDAFPVVQFTAEQAGRFVIRVGMAACSLDPCYFEVMVLGSEGAAPTPSFRRPALLPTAR